jgi:hypothetical protein
MLMVRIRVARRPQFYKFGGRIKERYVRERVLIEFPSWFAEQIKDLIGAEVDFERRGDEIIIRPKRPR